MRCPFLYLYICGFDLTIFLRTDSVPHIDFCASSCYNVLDLGQHRIIGQGDSARDFGTSESMENAGILDVFPIFHTARLGQKIRRSPHCPLCGIALELNM